MPSAVQENLEVSLFYKAFWSSALLPFWRHGTLAVLGARSLHTGMSLCPGIYGNSGKWTYNKSPKRYSLTPIQMLDFL